MVGVPEVHGVTSERRINHTVHAHCGALRRAGLRCKAVQQCIEGMPISMPQE